MEDVAGGLGADYLIENDLLYKSTGKDWAWQAITGANPLVSSSGKVYRWRVRPGLGGRRVLFDAATANGAEVGSAVIPVKRC
ncbi:hypothetical protein [Actinoplanes sp. L3-i22]|uniref:hypothetical protein n=1 Tax=Actinoplanes sp. L3-i22 TaxID=2836373 RepID=UPI001C77FAA4|nr:hypothetical protein [Actinoplanes sp. L3-i22]BCY08302.1 hypothetical protein L3i22_033900 [Actinoplanes sp. L3-i22]